MENKNYKEEKFDSFLTKTIILSSKRYFKKEINTNRKEQIIFDDQNYSAFIQGFFDSQNPNFESTIDLSISVKEALKSLSAIEQSVIFLLFNEDLSQKEAAQILEIYSKTVSKIKISRRILKMKNKNMYELGILAQKGNEMAMLEIIDRKKPLLKKYSFGDEDRYQYLILKLIEGIKNYKF